MDGRCLQDDTHAASLSKREQTGEGRPLCSRVGQPCLAPDESCPFCAKVEATPESA